MSEIPIIGRNPVYIVTIFLFAIISILSNQGVLY
jgi:hypothetical protein